MLPDKHLNPFQEPYRHDGLGESKHLEPIEQTPNAILGTGGGRSFRMTSPESPTKRDHRHITDRA